MICGSCGAENRAGRKFCSACGAPLAVACPSCGAANEAGDRFCGECASPLAEGREGARPIPTTGAVSTAGPGPVAERRLVSVLFADLVGFTPFAEERDPEEVRDVLTRYFELARDVIERTGGTVEKFIGDAVMALWGAPVAREDDAERAVRAALDLADSVRALGPTIQCRAAVLTGEAAVTLAATNQGMVAGDLVNTAARLQSVAEPGTVLVGESTMLAAAAAIAFEPLGDQALKGKSSPVPAWRALRVVAERGGRGRSDLPEPPFVGRDEELRLLKDILSVSARDPRARLVSITGPAGIGKSRLAWELAKHVDGLVEDVYWHRGRSPAYGEGITFWALGEMVRRRAGLAESDDEPVTRERIAAMLVEWVPDPADRSFIEPALLALLGLQDAPAGGRDVLFAAWRLFFERVAARGTTVLLFEDLQWADSGLLDFIDHVLEWSRGLPLLIVTLARPELFDRRPGWGAATRNLTSMALEPLKPAAMEALLDGFVPGLPPAARSAILARAEGVPLYAVETVRMLVAEGRLERSNGGYRPTGELGEVAVPDTLRSLIASRLDALTPKDRGLLQDASVLGTTFTVPGLEAVTGRPAAELEPELHALVRRELLELDVDPRSPERGQYGFVQALIREVAYSTLAKPERRTRHLAVARFFESLGDEELAGGLAGHYLAAFENSTPGPEADAVAVQARLAFRGAAERSAALGAHEQAVAHVERALELTTDPADRVGLLVLAARSASSAGHPEPARSFAERAVEAASATGDEVGVARARGVLATMLMDAAEIEPASRVLETALEALPASGADAVRARLLADLARADFRSDRAEAALVHAEAALTLAEPLRLDDVIADAFNNRAAALSYLGRRQEAQALLAAAVDVASRAGLIGTELRARNNVAATSWVEDPAHSARLELETLEVSRRAGIRNNVYWLVANIAYNVLCEGVGWDDTIAEIDDLIGDRDVSGVALRLPGARAMFRAVRGEPIDDAVSMTERHLRTSSAPEARMGLEFILALRDAAGDGLAAACDRLLALTATDHETIVVPWAIHPALWLGELPRARTIAERLDANPDARTPVMLAARTAAAAGIAALEGRPDEAIAGFADALRRYESFGWRFLKALVALDFVALLGPDEPAAREATVEARAVLEELRAAPFLARLDSVMSGASPPIAPPPSARTGQATSVTAGGPTAWK
jgi:class 3 adenylate cyclase/tetratricopeptide (TPR) repeat protein